MSENKPILIALAVVALALVGFAIYYISGDEPAPVANFDPVPIPEQPAPVAEVPAPEPPPLVVPDSTPIVIPERAEPSFVLPRLDSSDQLIRDGVVSLTRHEGINRWLGANELVRKSVVFVDNIANGNINKQASAALAPRGEIVVKAVSDKVYVMQPASFDRYNHTTNILVSLDTKRTVEFYVLLRPLFEQAYDELGYPNARIEDAIFKAIGRLLETPVITEPIRLVRPVVVYEYEDPRLEALSPAQKQLIRMGPQNTRAIQAKLSEFALELRSVLEQ